MRISNIGFETAKRVVFYKNNINFSRPDLICKADSISFTSKTNEQKELTQEAKDLSKEAYKIFARGKAIQKQTQSIIDKSNQIMSKAYELQNEAQDKFLDIQNILEYAREYKVKACADPFKQTQIIFNSSSSKKIESMIEYKNGAILRSAEKKENLITLFENNGKGKLTRTIYDAATGDVLRVDEGFEQATENNFYSDVSYEFENNRLIRCSFALNQAPRLLKAKERFEYQDGYLDTVSLSFNMGKNGFSSSLEEYWFEKDKLTNYFKGKQTKMASFTSSDEEYTFGNVVSRYIKDKNCVFGSITTANKVFCYSGSKIQKAVVGLSADCSSRIIEKYFTYNQNERPQACYLIHQTNRAYEFDFDSDFNAIYDKLVWL